MLRQFFCILFFCAGISSTSSATVIASNQVLNEDVGVQELVQEQKKVQDQYRAISQISPLSLSDTSMIDSSNLPAQLKQLKWIGSYMQSPSMVGQIQKIFSLVQDSSFQKNVTSVVQSPHIKTFFISLVVIMIIYYFIKSKILSLTNGFIKRIFVRLVLWALLSFTVYGLLSLCFGEAFFKVCKNLTDLFL